MIQAFQHAGLSLISHSLSAEFETIRVKVSVSEGLLQISPTLGQVKVGSVFYYADKTEVICQGQRHEIASPNAREQALNYLCDRFKASNLDWQTYAA